MLPSGLMVKVRGGTAPFTWMVDGQPLEVATRDRESILALPETGFVTLSVIDAKGRSARSVVRVW